MTNDSLVSIVNTTVYGRSKKYRLEDTSEVTLVQWAVETKQLLLAHPELPQRQPTPIVGQPKCWRIGFRHGWPSIAGELLSLVGELLTSPSSPTKPFTVGQL